MTIAVAARGGVRRRVAARCRAVVEAAWFDPLMLAVIVVNAIILGLETYESVDASIGDALHLANDVVLAAFVCELILRMAAHADRPAAFWRSGWNVFDFVVIAASFVPGVRENATLLRLARLLRIVRAVRLLPDVRVLTVAVGRSIPGVASSWPRSWSSTCSSGSSSTRWRRRARSSCTAPSASC